jgi:hypothetical protein
MLRPALVFIRARKPETRADFLFVPPRGRFVITNTFIFKFVFEFLKNYTPNYILSQKLFQGIS